MWIGDVVADRFAVEESIGKGGMGSVFRASDRLTGATVAIKVSSAPKGDLLERFRREGRVLSELNHPAIVEYIAHGETRSGEPYLVMEWLRGEDLDQRLGRAPLSVSETLALCGRVCEGLEAAHARGIVHRDIKPTNLFLVDNDPLAVKILDFGIARVRETTHAATKTGSVLGTPGYMAPEQARADDIIGTQADVFSLGCVLYECLTGKPAFAGVQLGDYERAETVANECLALAERLSLPFPAVIATQAFAIANRGNPEIAEAVLKKSAQDSKSRGARVMEGAIRIWCCRVMLMRGALDLAEAEAEAAVDLVAASDPSKQAYALAALARVRLEQHRASDAVEPAQKAFEVAEGLGCIEDGDVFVRLTYAEILDTTGDHAAAREVLRAARGQVVARAERIDDDNLRRSFLERVPENARTSSSHANG